MSNDDTLAAGHFQHERPQTVLQALPHSIQIHSFFFSVSHKLPRFARRCPFQKTPSRISLLHAPMGARDRQAEELRFRLKRTSPRVVNPQAHRIVKAG
jgi:hypothetical protein